MVSKHATAEDFLLWKEKAKSMTNYALWWSTNDALMAAKACESFDPIRAGKLRDEAYTYHAEAKNRLGG